MDNNETVTISLNSAAINLDGRRYRVTDASDSGIAYTSALTISPLAHQDAGQYTCTGRIIEWRLQAVPTMSKMQYVRRILLIMKIGWVQVFWFIYFAVLSAFSISAVNFV